MTGTGSTWSMGGTNLDVGDQSEGILNITAGGAVSNHNGNIGFAEGTVNVSGTGSKWTNTGGLFIGRNTNGRLNITAGGLVTNVNGALGTDTFGHGFVNVSGAGSKWINSGQLTVGDIGEATGHVTIENGGAVSNTNGIIGKEGVFSDFAAAIGTVDVIGPGTTWTNSGDLSVGRGGIGTLSVAGGGAVSSNIGYVAYAADSEGYVTVSGAGSKWTSASNLEVGRQGAGTLRITDGGKVAGFNNEIGGTVFTQPGIGSGEVLVTGPGSTLASEFNTHIGYVGAGTLTIENGGNVTDANGFVATFIGSTGTATVTGAGSTWTNTDSINIGSSGNGTLVVADGGVVTNTDGQLAPHPVQWRGHRSRRRLIVEYDRRPLSRQGAGKLTIENGGSVSSNSGNIGRAGGTPFGGGLVTVTGTGSTWTNTNELRVGNNGLGTLNIRNGGKVSNTAAYIATTVGSAGTVTVEGIDARWNIAGRLSVAGDADTATSGGGTRSISIRAGLSPCPRASRSFPMVPSNSKAERSTHRQSAFRARRAVPMDGWNAARGHLQWQSFESRRRASPGHSAGLTTVVGNYTQQAAGSLEIEIGGPSAFDNDLVNVLGTASLSGQLQLALINGFSPGAGQTFSIMQATTLTGTFGNVANGQRVTTIDDLGSFQVHYGTGSTFNPNQIVIDNFVANPLPGDFNHNGVVDAPDYNLWRKLDLGPAAYNTWRQNFGRTAAVGLGSGAENVVPEPGTIVLFAMGLLSLYSRRPQRRRGPISF